uniref:Uncharacterized protein n=1 Tax=Ciona savignyi TaxID=51511 RepID=H2Z6W1_CIOSA
MSGLNLIEKYIFDSTLVKHNLLPAWESIRGAIYVAMIVVVTYVLAVVDYKRIACTPIENRQLSGSDIDFADGFCLLQLPVVYRYFGLIVASIVIGTVSLDKWWLSVPCVRTSITTAVHKVDSAKKILKESDFPNDKATTLYYWFRSFVFLALLLSTGVLLSIEINKTSLPGGILNCSLQVNTNTSISGNFLCIYPGWENMQISFDLLLGLLGVSCLTCCKEMILLIGSCCTGNCIHSAMFIYYDNSQAKQLANLQTVDED